MKIFGKKQTDLIIKPSQLVLLTCHAPGCHNQANPEHAVVTGVLGIIGKVVVYFCDDCEKGRREKKAEHNFKRKKKAL